MPDVGDSSCASSSACSSISSARRSSTRFRCAGSASAQPPASNARRAARTARSTSSAAPAATDAITVPSRGETSSNVAPSAAGTNPPSMNASVLTSRPPRRKTTPPPRRARSRARAHRAREPCRRRRPDGLGEHEVAPLRRPSRRVVWVLEIRSAAHAGAHVQVGEQTDAVRPRVRGEPAVAPQRQLGERARARDPEREHDVGLVDVERIGLEREPQLLERARHLTAGDPHAGLLAQRPHARRDLRRPAAPRPTARRSSRRRSTTRRASAGPRPRSMSPAIRHHWLRSTMIVEPVADRRAHRRDDRDALVEPVARDPDLDRAEAALHERAARPRRAAPAIAQLAPRRVGGTPPSAPPSSTATGWPAACPSRSHSAASSGQ